jgi:rubredoxin
MKSFQCSPETKWKHCSHPEHNPPGYMSLRPGKHIWVCPQCGAERIIYIPKVQYAFN